MNHKLHNLHEQFINNFILPNNWWNSSGILPTDCLNLSTEPKITAKNILWSQPLNCEEFSWGMPQMTIDRSIMGTLMRFNYRWSGLIISPLDRSLVLWLCFMSFSASYSLLTDLPKCAYIVDHRESDEDRWESKHSFALESHWTWW